MRPPEKMVGERKMRLTKKTLVEFGRACTRNEAGEHFTQWLDYEPLERLGLIAVYRPVHGPTGIPYGQEEWRIETTPLGEWIAERIFDRYGQLVPNAVARAERAMEAA